MTTPARPTNNPQLIMELHPNGKMFLEVDSLIEWFNLLARDGEKEKDDVKYTIGKGAALALEGMKEKSLKNPTKIMSEKEYYE